MPDSTPSVESFDGKFDNETIDDGPRSAKVRAIPAAGRAWSDAHPDTFSERYGLESADLLGQGGMGVIRACRDRRIGRQVALKTMHPVRAQSPESAARFLREACVQGQLEHPSIVPVYDVGVTSGGGELYFTMKRVDGVTLRDVFKLLRAGDPFALRTYTRRKLLTAFASVCLAVHYAHSRGVLHRDLKPVNIMLGSFGEVYVLDWGIARVLAAPDSVTDPMRAGEAGDDPSVTGAGFSLGTLGYMAPEQARGETVDARCDVHALGAILFELLTLERFVGREEKQAMRDGKSVSVESRPSMRVPRAAVPPELEAAIVRATATDPAARFSSARELADAIERFLDGDRDLERRRELAHAHIDSVRRALGGRESSETRARVLRELGQALALDPENADAAGMLMRVLTSPPPETPPEVSQRIERQRKSEQVVTLRSAALELISILTVVPLAALMGAKALAWCFVTTALGAGAIVTSLWGARNSPARARTPYLPTFVLACAALSTVSGFFGPLFFMPTLLLAVVAIGMSRSDRKSAPIVIVVGLVALLVPVCLEWAGVLPPSFRLNGSELVLLPRAASFLPVATLGLIFLGNLTAFLVTALHIGRIRRALTGVQEELELQRWQLERLALAASR